MRYTSEAWTQKELRKTRDELKALRAGLFTTGETRKGKPYDTTDESIAECERVEADLVALLAKHGASEFPRQSARQ